MNKLEDLLSLCQNPLIKSVFELISRSLLKQLMIINELFLRFNLKPVDLLDQKSD